MTITARQARTLCARAQSDRSAMLITLTSLDADEAADVIGRAVDTWSDDRRDLTTLTIDEKLGRELGLDEGDVLPRGRRPVVHLEAGLGRVIRFEARR